jgi:hypothetical protein
VHRREVRAWCHRGAWCWRASAGYDQNEKHVDATLAKVHSYNHLQHVDVDVGETHDHNRRQHVDVDEEDMHKHAYWYNHAYRNQADHGTRDPLQPPCSLPPSRQALCWQKLGVLTA